MDKPIKYPWDADTPEYRCLRCKYYNFYDKYETGPLTCREYPRGIDYDYIFQKKVCKDFKSKNGNEEKELKAMNTFNLLGRVGQEVELKQFDDGDSYCGVSLATEKNWINKESNEWKSKTIWHNVFFTKVLAENISKAIKKGDLIRIMGELDYQKIEDTNKRSVILRGKQFERYHRPKGK